MCWLVSSLKESMRRSGLAASVAAMSFAGWGVSTASTQAPAAAQAAQKPSIPFVVADELGRADVGFNGSDINTPAIDRLAAEGTRLGQCYLPPIGTPTRSIGRANAGLIAR
jgi:arylsulfatase I/J